MSNIIALGLYTRLKCYYAFFLVCCGCDTSYIVLIHIQCQASIYTLSLCRGHSWWVRLAKQETLTLSGHLVSPLVCGGPWMSTVVLYCWCHSDSALVLLYFTLVYFPFINDVYFYCWYILFDICKERYMKAIILWGFVKQFIEINVSKISRIPN